NMSATRWGVFSRPGREGSSPTPSRMRRTPRAIFGLSTAAPLPSGDLAGDGLAAGVRAPSGGSHPDALAAGALGPLHQAVEEGHQLLLLDGLLLDEGHRDLVEPVAHAGEDLESLVVGLVDEVADLRVDLEGDLIGVIRMRGEVPTQKDLPLLLAERHRPELVGHPVLGDHL